MALGRLAASSMNSFAVFQGDSARTAKTVGSAVNRAIGRRSASANSGARPNSPSASGITVKLDSASSTV